MEMNQTLTTAAGADELAAVLTGAVVTPADEGWDLARQAWNLAVDQRPVLVALPADADDVVAIVDWARANGFRIAPQGTGHNASAIASLENTILLSTQRMRGVEVDVEAQIARVQAGTHWIEVTEASSPHGLFPLSGSSPDVGVVGYTLGGGLSWLARKHGLASNSVTAIELVTPDGELLRATAHEHADLFWALRGGGGSFGVVTAMEFRLFPYGEVYAGMFLFPFERAGEVLRGWRDWTSTAPEDVTTSIRLLHLPPLPDLPEFLRGRSVVVIDGAFTGDADGGAEAVAALRALEPELDTWAMVPAVALSRLHMDPEEPMPGASGSTMLGPLDDAGLSAFEAGIQPGAPLLFAELRQLGGALAREPEGAGALGSLDADYGYYANGLAVSPEMRAAVAAAAAQAVAALSPYATGSGYLNFVEQPTDTSKLYTAEAYERLRAVRTAVDPDGVMVSNHPIPAA
ncbi:MAG TPA: FAD-binding oxidoreductase [Solirubrobacteraceae bacterium]|jgi:FAD/FMN-containing dehydrogenase|nr:FAD-binding oxidoreductase [Solirubrobacteraceae bacterium]